MSGGLMDFWVLYLVWALGAVAWVAVWLDSRAERPRLSRHSAWLWALGTLLTVGVGAALYRSFVAGRKATPRVPRPPVVLRGGTFEDHIAREADAAALDASAEATDATLTPTSGSLSDDERRNLRERLRNRGVLDPLDE
jgi:hypothetical protein